MQHAAGGHSTRRSKWHVAELTAQGWHDDGRDEEAGRRCRGVAGVTIRQTGPVCMFIPVAWTHPARSVAGQRTAGETTQHAARSTQGAHLLQVGPEGVHCPHRLAPVGPVRDHGQDAAVVGPHLVHRPGRGRQRPAALCRGMIRSTESGPNREGTRKARSGSESATRRSNQRPAAPAWVCVTLSRRPRWVPPPPHTPARTEVQPQTNL